MYILTSFRLRGWQWSNVAEEARVKQLEKLYRRVVHAGTGTPGVHQRDVNDAGVVVARVFPV